MRDVAQKLSGMVSRRCGLWMERVEGGGGRRVAVVFFLLASLASSVVVVRECVLPVVRKVRVRLNFKTRVESHKYHLNLGR